jgi:hypothetical protein
MLDWVKTGEAALSGTAAVLAGVGTLVHRGTEHRVGTGEVGPVTQRPLRFGIKLPFTACILTPAPQPRQHDRVTQQYGNTRSDRTGDRATVLFRRMPALGQ